MAKKQKFEKFDSKETEPELVAKKDFEICFNEFHRKIKVGDNLSDIPEMFLENLKTEGVI